MHMCGAGNSRFKLLARVKSDHAAGSYRDLFTCFRVASWPLWLVSQLKVAEARKLYRLASFERKSDLIEKPIDHILGLTLVQTEAVKQRLGELGLGHRSRVAVGRMRCACSARQIGKPEVGCHLRLLSTRTRSKALFENFKNHFKCCVSIGVVDRAASMLQNDAESKTFIFI